jgi:hypothetical protein
MRDWKVNQRKRTNLMISKIISRAACLAELASNPNSFFNCPDLHGGVPGLPEVAQRNGSHGSVRLGQNSSTPTTTRIAIYAPH